MDDDVFFQDRSFKAMMEFWDTASPNVGGASFNLSNYRYSMTWLKSLPQRLFFINNHEFGKVLRSGFNTPSWTVESNTTSR